MWNSLSKILNIVLGLLTLYFYIENRKLRRYEIDKDIEVKKIEIRELRRSLRIAREKMNEDMAQMGLAYSSIREKNDIELQAEYGDKEDKLKSKLSYLEKLRSYRWIFTK